MAPNSDAVEPTHVDSTVSGTTDPENDVNGSGGTDGAGDTDEDDGTDDRSSNRTIPRRWQPAVAFAAVLCVGSLVPIPGDPSGGAGVGLPGGFGLTAPFHFAGYAVLAALLTRGTGRLRRGLLLAAALATGFGFGIELAQATIPWRTFAWGDVAINAVGAVVGVAGVRLAEPFVTSRGNDP